MFNRLVSTRDDCALTVMPMAQLHGTAAIPTTARCLRGSDY